ncbi:hypothetical protein [Brochothrix thermosphacta]|uniref:hypothetical protein n=1 Tax=Brochothrix thermosphacta TaxID=2756 RepID=UPI0039AF5410
MNWLGKDEYKEVIDNNEWLIKHKEKSIYIMTDHKLAFMAWELERLEREYKGAELYHVDTHLDEVSELVNSDDFMNASTKEDLINLYTKSLPGEYTDENKGCFLRMDNFIMPAFARDTIDVIHHISNVGNAVEMNQKHLTVDIINQQSDENLDSRRDGINEYELRKFADIIKGKTKIINRWNGIMDITNSSRDNTDKIKILDLDIDYFNNATTLATSGYVAKEFKQENIIKSELKALKEYTDWDIITVAISPYYSGYEDSKIILNLFLEEFTMDIDKDFEIFNLQK